MISHNHPGASEFWVSSVTIFAAFLYLHVWLRLRSHDAGAMMWTCVTVVYLIAGTVFTAGLLSPLRLPHPSEELASSQFDSRRIEMRTDLRRTEVV
jgi:hypothetical protein